MTLLYAFCAGLTRLDAGALEVTWFARDLAMTQTRHLVNFNETFELEKGES
jgi:hypothetical protein